MLLELNNVANPPNTTIATINRHIPSCSIPRFSNGNTNNA